MSRSSSVRTGTALLLAALTLATGASTLVVVDATYDLFPATDDAIADSPLDAAIADLRAAVPIENGTASSPASTDHAPDIRVDSVGPPG
jgi:hypothetical protein